MKSHNCNGIHDKGRTPIHNIFVQNLTNAQYVDHIEKFTKRGYDIDAQTSQGKTALHLAVEYQNKRGIDVLLLAGADINIVDTNNQTPFTKSYDKISDFNDPMSIDNIFDKYIITALAMQVIRLQVCKLEFSLDNNRLVSIEFSENEMQYFHQKILSELEHAKSIKIGTGALTLRDFLSETGAVASRPSITSEADRKAIDDFFGSIPNENFRKKFPELSYLFILQYRKMLARLPLMEAAADSVRELLGTLNGFCIPEMCCRMVIRFLTNTEIKMVIASMTYN